MKIKKATIHDSGILTEITMKSKAYWGYSEEQIMEWENFLTISIDYIEKNSVYKLIINNSIIGYYSYFKTEKDSIKLDNLFILPKYIGLGYGKKLMQDFINRIQTENSIKKITLDSEPNAEIFYQKIGFVKVGEFETSIKNRFMPIMEMYLKD